MGKTVLLLHELPDGGRHYDWLLERPGGGGAGVGAGTGEGPLVSFRVSDRIDAGAVEFVATRQADHRREYLTYEGPVSGGRGVVRRVAEGALEIEEDGPQRFRVRGRLGGATGVFEGHRGTGAAWSFTFVSGEE
ncbi:MAG: hypothetical protein WD749_07760 [Phycisphaerales bacterium]